MFNDVSILVSVADIVATVEPFESLSATDTALVVSNVGAMLVSGSGSSSSGSSSGTHGSGSGSGSGSYVTGGGVTTGVSIIGSVTGGGGGGGTYVSSCTTVSSVCVSSVCVFSVCVSSIISSSTTVSSTTG